MPLQTTLNFSKDVRTEALCTNLTYAWVNDHQIAIYRFEDPPLNQVADTWYKHVVKELQSKTFYIRFIFDFSGSPITDYYYQKIYDLSEACRSHSGRVVFVLREDTSGQRRVDILRAFNERRLPHWSVDNTMFSRYGAVDRTKHLDDLLTKEIKGKSTPLDRF